MATEAKLNEKYKEVGGITPLTVVPTSFPETPVTAIDATTGDRRVFPNNSTFRALQNKYKRSNSFMANAIVFSDKTGVGDYDAQETRMLRGIIEKNKTLNADADVPMSRYVNLIGSEINQGSVTSEGKFGIATYPTFPDNDYGVDRKDLTLIQKNLLNKTFKAGDFNPSVLQALRNKSPGNVQLRTILDAERIKRLGSNFDYVAGGEVFKNRVLKDATNLPKMISSENLAQLSAITGFSSPLISAWNGFQAFIENEPKNPNARALTRAIDFTSAIANSNAREIFGFDNQKLTAQIITLSKVLDIETGSTTSLTDVGAQAETVIKLIDNQIATAEKSIDNAYNNVSPSLSGVKAREKILGLAPYRQVLLDVVAQVKATKKGQGQDLLLQASEDAGYGVGWSTNYGK